MTPRWVSTSASVLVSAPRSVHAEVLVDELVHMLCQGRANELTIVPVRPNRKRSPCGRGPCPTGELVAKHFLEFHAYNKRKSVTGNPNLQEAWTFGDYAVPLVQRLPAQDRGLVALQPRTPRRSGHIW